MIQELIQSVALPTTNVYFENDSADGFAFLGAAKALLGLNAELLCGMVRDRKYRLNAARKVKKTKVKVPEDNVYVYTLWASYELFAAVQSQEDLVKIRDMLKTIGFYPNGLIKYCTTEIHYGVPNAASAAALLFAYYGDLDLVSDLVGWLRDAQKNGNWHYQNMKSGKVLPPEDPYHVAMIAYQLRELQRLHGIKTDDIVEHSIADLSQTNKREIDGGSIGWGVPMIYLATIGLAPKLSRRAFRETTKSSIVHSNFRTRAIAAWALAKGLSYEQET